MKKIIGLAILAVGMANAMTRVAALPSDVLIELYDTPLQTKMSDGTEKRVRIYRNGEVTTYRCTVNLPMPCKPEQKVATLNAAEVTQLKKNIKVAAAAKLVTWNGATCLALPTRYMKLSANPGNVVISEGNHPCGRPTYRDSKITDVLKKQVFEYFDKYLDR